VLSRYEKEFGSRNYQFSAGKVDFVVVDAQTLDGMFLHLHLCITALKALKKSTILVQTLDSYFRFRI
jgi:hypothetical protein